MEPKDLLTNKLLVWVWPLSFISKCLLTERNGTEWNGAERKSRGCIFKSQSYIYMYSSVFQIYGLHCFTKKRKINVPECENSMPKDANFCSPRFFSFFGENLPKFSGITHVVTSNGAHPLHHHLRHSVRLSNSLFNRRTTKPTFTQWLQASTL